MSNFLIGDGRMAQKIASHSWSETPLGPIETWPAALRSVLQMMLYQRQAICLFWGPELRILYNDAYAPILGKREPLALGQPFAEVWSDVWTDVKPFADTALRGEGTFSEDLPLTMTRNGYEEETFWTFSYSPLFNDGNQIAGIINVAIETTTNVLARRAQTHLQRELMHRVKNSFAVTNAIVAQTLRHAKSLDVAREEISRRLAAVGAAQNLLQSGDDSVDVETLLRQTLAAHIDKVERIDSAGPPVELQAQQAIGLSLALYELATNAIKYGSLSSDSGRVEVRWELDGTNFAFIWQEVDGPPVTAPDGKGFGSILTNQVVGSYFGGSATTSYAADGVRYHLLGTLQTAS